MARVSTAEFTEAEVTMLLDAIDTKVRSVNVTSHRTKSPNLLSAYKLEQQAFDALKAKLLSRSVIPQ